jgi:putative glycosyltransferase (TIGR04372 family)
LPGLGTRPDVASGDRASLLTQAQALADAGNLQDADHACRKILHQHPNDAAALHLAGVLAHRRGSATEALDLLRAAIEQEPLEARHLIALAFTFHSLGRLDESMGALERAETLAPADASIQLELGLIEQRKGAVALAARRFRKVLAVEPTHVPAQVLLGRINASTGDNASARVLASHLRALDPGRPEALLFVFDAMLLEDPAAAADYLSRALSKLAAPIPSVGMALCRVAFGELVGRGHWSDGNKLLANFRVFREAWWQEVRRSRVSSLVIGPRFIPYRIGEVASHLGNLVKAKLLGWFPDIEMVLPVPANGGANPAYLEYWRPWFTFLETPGLADDVALRTPSYEIVFERDGNGQFYGQHDMEHVTERAWLAEGRPPLLSVTEQHRELGYAKLRSLGVPADAWFVVLHVREGAYMTAASEAHGRTDDHNAHRNSNILDYLEAAQQITARGGWVLRIGHVGTRPLPAMERVIDVAHTGTTPEFDVFLLGTCRFFLGDSSGPVVVATTFKRPVVAANFEMGGAPSQAGDLYVPKLYRDLRSKDLISLKRALAPPLFRPHDARLLAREGVEAVDSSSSEIADLTREMLNRLDGKETYSAQDDALQGLVHGLFPPGATLPNSRIGKAFLQAHRDLLD